MDVGLPGLDGWEATRRLKADEQTRQIPVVALTAHALAEHRAQAIAAGCDGDLAKPVEPRGGVTTPKRSPGESNHRRSTREEAPADAAPARAADNRRLSVRDRHVAVRD